MESKESNPEPNAPSAPGEALASPRPPEPSEPPREGAALGPVGADPAPPDVRKRASLAFLLVLTFISVVADLGTKWWATDRLSSIGGGRGLHRIEVIKGYMSFTFAQNPGGAWSFLRSLPDTLRRPFFLVVSAAAIVFIVSIYRRVYRDQTAMKWGLPLALGGAIGNLADRVRYGWVVDFIDFYVKRGGREHHWPTFNVADIAIVIGVALMAIEMARRPPEPDKGDDKSEEGGPTAVGPAPLNPPSSTS